MTHMDNVLVIVGSHRADSNSAKVATWITGQINKMSADTVVNVYDFME